MKLIKKTSSPPRSVSFSITEESSSSVLTEPLSPPQASIVYMLLGSPLHSGPTVTVSFPSPSRMEGVGETQHSTKRRRRDQRNESRSLRPAPPAAPRPKGPFARARRVAPPPHSPHPLSERPQRKSRRQQILGDLKEGWKKLQERSWVHSLRAGKGCRGTPPPPPPGLPEGDSRIQEPTTLPPTRSQPPPDRGSIQLPSAACGARLRKRGRGRAETHR